MKIIKNLNLNENVFNKIVEGGTSRIYHHISETDNWAIISTFRGERNLAENMELLKELKRYCTSNNYGFIEFISRWVENGESFDERSLLIPNMGEDEASMLGDKYNQSSVIVKSDGVCKEICTAPFEVYDVGDTVRTFNVSGDKVLNIEDAKAIFEKRRGGPVSKPVKGNRPFALASLEEVYEVESPRPSYFQKNERLTRIY